MYFCDRCSKKYFTPPTGPTVPRSPLQVEIKKLGEGEIVSDRFVKRKPFYKCEKCGFALKEIPNHVNKPSDTSGDQEGTSG